MSYAAKVRRAVARQVYPDNPASVSLARSAVALAELADTMTGRPEQGWVLSNMRHALTHLRYCGPGQRERIGVVDLVARVCARRAEGLTVHYGPRGGGRW